MYKKNSIYIDMCVFVYVCVKGDACGTLNELLFDAINRKMFKQL